MLSHVITCTIVSRLPLTCHSAVLTLCACTPPLDQVLLLWDFLLAFGVHLNVLCVIAQLLLIRDDVMSSSSYVSPILHPTVRNPYRMIYQANASPTHLPTT